jgi:nucleotide-binding universal stress UspA family protein
MRILLAVDLGDENLDRLVAESVDWGQRLSGTIDLFFVDTFPYASAAVHDATTAAILQREYASLRKTNLERLEGVLERLPESMRGTVRAVEGARPADEVVHAAPSYDLVLVGTHGRTGITSFLLGSVAERIVRLCPVPTLVVRV